LTALLTLVSSVQCCLSFPTGEISDALKDVWGDHVPRSDVVTGAYASQYGSAEDEAEFQDTVQEVDAFFQKEGRRPRMLVCKMGQDGHDRGGKVIASGFADLGFDVSRCLMCDVLMFRCFDVPMFVSMCCRPSPSLAFVPFATQLTVVGWCSFTTSSFLWSLD